MTLKDSILRKIENKSIQIAIIGLGYVGLPLALTFGKKSLKVIGFDLSKKKVQSVNSGENYIQDIDNHTFKQVVRDGYLRATEDFSTLSECQAIIICVPTPLDKFKNPDMSHIQESCKQIGKYMTKGTIVSLESTTYPTTTENFMKPILEEYSGFKQGTDFWLAFSPERVDPGNTEYKTENTPKIFGAMSADGQEIGLALYHLAIKTIHPVSSPRIAEMVKILENSYRLVNISLINEMALLCGKMGIDIWEVVDAAKTKPYGFQAFYPGPGIGGHCIPLDPFYLEYVAKEYDFYLEMIHSAGHIETLMPHRMSVKITSALNTVKKSINGSKLLFVGVAYKSDIDDPRESSALKIIDEVVRKGAQVSYHDPYIPSFSTGENNQFSNSELTPDALKNSDCVIITTKHSNTDWDMISEYAELIVDLRHAIQDRSAKVHGI